MLTLEKQWTRQPSNRVKASRRWLDKGLFALFHPNSLQEVVSGIPWIVEGTPELDISKVGFGKKTDGVAEALRVTIPRRTISRWSIFALVKSAGPAADSRPVSFGYSFSETPLVMLNAGVTNTQKERQFARDDAANLAFLESSLNVYDGALHTVALICNGAGLSLYVDDTLETVNVQTQTYTNFTFDQFCVGALRRATTGSYWAGSIYLAAGFQINLSSRQVHELTGNPWQLFEPRRIYVPEGAPAAGFNPSWARNANTVMTGIA